MVKPESTSTHTLNSFFSLFAGNGGVGILHLSCINDENNSGLDQSCVRFDQKVSVAKTTRLSFVDDGMECAEMRLNGAFKGQRPIKSGVKQRFTDLLVCRGATGTTSVTASSQEKVQWAGRP